MECDIKWTHIHGMCCSNYQAITKHLHSNYNYVRMWEGSSLRARGPPKPCGSLGTLPSPPSCRGRAGGLCEKAIGQYRECVQRRVVQYSVGFPGESVEKLQQDTIH